MKERVVLGLSGGVDSAVAAELLLRQGYELFPLWLDVGTGAGEEDARAVADALGLPFARADISAELEAHVCRPFAKAYLSGHTPLPCAVCNPTVKFPALLRYADALGAAWVATGHYARVRQGENGRTWLARGEHRNDQSYLLSRLPQEILRRVIFPLGDYEKAQVRAMAGAAALPPADKPDSMDICFIPDGDYPGWLSRRGPVPPEGDFLSKDGKVLGRHKGYHCYTLGQRRGLGVSGPHRYFVSAIDPAANTVTLSDGSDLQITAVSCTGLNWISIPAPEGSLSCTVRLRHSKAETPAHVFPHGDGALISLDRPARSSAPGQLAVFYDGDVVLGSGWIV